MTQEEKQSLLKDLCNRLPHVQSSSNELYNDNDWLKRNHLDYSGLIEKGSTTFNYRSIGRNV